MTTKNTITIGVVFPRGRRTYTYEAGRGVAVGDTVEVYSEYPEPGHKLVKVVRVDDFLDTSGGYTLQFAKKVEANA